MRFSEILLIATVITGGVWVLDVLFLRHRRMMYVLSNAHQPVKEPRWIEYSKAFFPILLIVFLLRSFLAEPFRIPSGSMRPTLLEGDFIVVNKFDYGFRLPLLGNTLWAMGTPKRGDVIVFKHIKNGESLDMIKRVVGLPHDHIQYKNKILYINGEPIKQEFQTEKLDINPQGVQIPVRVLTEYIGENKHTIFIHSNDRDAFYHYPYDDVIVPPNHYFVLGDNRDGSADGRMWGFVNDKDVQGRAIAIWMSWDGEKQGIPWYRWYKRLRWERLGMIQ